MSSFKVCFLYFSTSLLLGSCGMRYQNKTPKSIQIEVPDNTAVNYGTPISFKILGTYNNGKTKYISNHRNIKCVASKGFLDGNKLTPISQPTNFNDTSITLTASFEKDNVIVKDSLTLDFNYLSDLRLNFKGINGADGKDGKKGALNFLTRSGTDGTDGEDGLDGTNGHDLMIHIWRVGEKYHLRIHDQTTEQAYYYALKPTNYKLILDVSGGNGGNGGNGGLGGDGKDEVVKNGKTKDAGYGGNGGNGGNGAAGGKAGNVTVFLHPDAANFENNIVTTQNAGRSGKLGIGGKGGQGGKSLHAETHAVNGAEGTSGLDGPQTAQNNMVNIEIQYFEISHFEPK